MGLYRLPWRRDREILLHPEKIQITIDYLDIVLLAVKNTCQLIRKTPQEQIIAGRISAFNRSEFAQLLGMEITEGI